MSEYDIAKIIYKRGKCNCDADLLSRFPHEESDKEDETQIFKLCSISSSKENRLYVNAITRATAKRTPTIDQQNEIDSVSSLSQEYPMINPIVTPENDSRNEASDIHLTNERIRAEQRNDPQLRTIIESIKNTNTKGKRKYCRWVYCANDHSEGTNRR